MPIPDSTSRQRLAAMGIDVWVRRQAVPVTPEQALQSDSAPTDPNLRIRVSSGDGDWVLVQREPWSGRHEQLLADITALIGAERCRYGQWAVSDSAGVPVAELDSRGIAHVLAFGEVPRPVSSPRVCLVPALDEVATSADARRRLWQVLAPRLAN
jgi:hypothetical protein